jgi:hypothetical protein
LAIFGPWLFNHLAALGFFYRRRLNIAGKSTKAAKKKSLAIFVTAFVAILEAWQF